MYIYTHTQGIQSKPILKKYIYMYICIYFYIYVLYVYTYIYTLIHIEYIFNQ